jgi:hypothetical protein
MESEMNQVSRYLVSIDRPPYVNGRRVGQATPCSSYGQPSWFISFRDGYTHTNNPVFTDEDGLNSATSIQQYATNLGFEPCTN